MFSIRYILNKDDEEELKSTELAGEHERWSSRYEQVP